MSLIYQMSFWQLAFINFTYQFLYGILIRSQMIAQNRELKLKEHVALALIHFINALLGTLLFATLMLGLLPSVVLLSLATLFYFYRAKQSSYFSTEECWDYLYMHVPYILVGILMVRG